MRGLKGRYGTSSPPPGNPARGARGAREASGRWRVSLVYIQGFYCVDGDGNVVFERKLEPSAVEAAEELVAEFGISSATMGTICTQRNEQISW